ncbi:MAG: S-ribosylhomocysteine lyase, partial [Pygmaiobacter massiliensis]
MQRIASFSVDHTKLDRGMYTSRVDGDVVTYDIRMKRPNAGEYLENAAMHTFEHLFATYARSSALSDKVVYVGPMGCRTGFYLLVRGMSEQEAILLVQQSMAFIAAYEGEIPGATEPECGNYSEQDLLGAKREAADMAQVLQNWTAE